MPPAYAKSPDPTAYATPRTIRPYSLGQNPEWDAVSRMLAAGLVTVCPDPMGMGFVRVEMVRRDHALAQNADGVWTAFEGVLTHKPKGPETHG